MPRLNISLNIVGHLTLNTHLRCVKLLSESDPRRIKEKWSELTP
jgi:hypothetical protein